MLNSRRLTWAGHVERVGEGDAYRVLVGKVEGRRPFISSRHRWKDNIKMNLREVGRESMDWIDMAQDRDRCRALVCAVVNLRVS